MELAKRHYTKAELASRIADIVTAEQILKRLDEERWYPQMRHARCRKTLRQEVYDLNVLNNDQL